jgi:hypothetical protein
MELKVQYWKVEMNRKLLKLIIAMDACEFIITIEWAKRLEKENVNSNTRLCSQIDNLRESSTTIERLQLNIQELSYHVPITQKQLEDM